MDPVDPSVNLGLIWGRYARPPGTDTRVRLRRPRPKPSYIRLWRAASELTTDDWEAGRAWYPKAIVHLESEADHWRLEYARVAYAAAVLSPGLSWRATMEVLHLLLWTRAQGKPLPIGEGHMTFGARDRRKAWALLDAEEPEEYVSGPKVAPFAMALLGATDVAVVDRHIIRIATGVDTALGPSAMDMIAASLMTIAWAKREPTTVVQAALWCAKAG